ncbi:hypothetical protein OAL38_01040 [bacterium]|nr:hypothetical protein [bacterium]
MKSHSVIFRGRSFFEIAGLFIVFSLFAANSFHYNIQSPYLYYRELFGILFIALIIWHCLLKSTNVGGLSWPIFYLLLFPVMLIFWSVLDTGISLYAGGDAAMSSEHLQGASQMKLVVYVLRNALLYLPLVVYLYLRGLNTQEIRLVALIAIVVAPFSISSYLQSGELGKMEMTLGKVAQLGGRGIAYNSYVPYLTFHILCGVYLLFSPVGRLIKAVVLGCVIYTILFVVFSTSRQSTLFIAITLFVFFLAVNRKSQMNKYITIGLVSLVLMAAFLYYTKNTDLDYKLIERFGSLQGFISDATSQRVALATHGLGILSPIEWFMGAGLTSVITSGPHNDYIRWTQRIGIPMMILGFLPFFMTFVRSFRLIRLRHFDNSLHTFLCLAIGFTLFHSVFGYPREEANQAITVYMGIAIWFGAYREGLIPKLRRSTKKVHGPANRDSNHAPKFSVHSAR